jgi:hypothetical protein
MQTLPEELRARYSSGRLVVFAGAGISVGGGLPSWPGLIGHVLEDARSSGADPSALAEIEASIADGDLVRALGELQSAMSSAAFGRAVARALDDSRHPAVPPLAAAIAGLAPTLHAVVTTNLDRFLERAFAGNWPHYTLPQVDLGQQDHYILKLHGDRTDRASWVLSERQYEDLLHGRPELQRFVEGLFRFHPLLFVGYGLRDPDFDRVCGQIRVFARGQAPQHFALMPAGRFGRYDRDRLADAGIELIEYANPDGSHAELLRVLRELGASQPNAAPPASEPATATSPVRAPAPAPARPREAPAAGSKKHVLLVLMACPADQAALDLAREAALIEEQFAHVRERFQLVWGWAVTAEQTLDLISDHDPAWIHFAGHGGLDGTLLLAGADRTTFRLRYEALARYLGALRRPPRCVTLNACFSGLATTPLTEHVDVVIGMRDEISDDTALTFSRRLYRELGKGRDLQEAFELARAALGALDPPADHLPQLCSRAGVDPATLTF